MMENDIEKARMASPFHPDNLDGFKRWKERKLRDYPGDASKLMVQITNPMSLSENEFNALRDIIAQCNMAIYDCQRVDPRNRSIALRLGEQFGLRTLDRNLLSDDDGLSSIQIADHHRVQEYIPYTNRSINWHTDGYYNTAERTIRGMILHCGASAQDGGDTELCDPDIVYLLMRDRNPDWIRALMENDTMIIPENRENNVLIREETGCPVFFIDQAGELAMRYTERKRNIVWKANEPVQSALGFIRRLLSGDSPYIFRVRLRPGQGLICNNVLHRRSSFTDDLNHVRVIYRGRYYERITV